MTVHLVGAGPGDPELLTLRAARLLGDADVVLYDRLVGPRVLDLVAPWCVLVPVGKDPEGHSVPQREIETLLIHYGRQYETVIRLKGGDPFLFGRGSEEAAALIAAGVEVQVVPGISSAFAAPAAAGIPVTSRGISSGVTVVTAHQCDSPSSEINWSALAACGTTLVVLMGARKARAVASALLSAGMASSTPTAIITRATLDSQVVKRMPLRDLAVVGPVENPSVLVIGAVANLNDTVTADRRVVRATADFFGDFGAQLPSERGPTGPLRSAGDVRLIRTSTETDHGGSLTQRVQRNTMDPWNAVTSTPWRPPLLVSTRRT